MIPYEEGKFAVKLSLMRKFFGPDDKAINPIGVCVGPLLYGLFWCGGGML